MKTKMTISKKIKKIKMTLLTIATIVSCIFISGCKEEGCTDSTASNYNSEADKDDGSCLYSGCMDPYADNYNSKATTDDGSCAYGTTVHAISVTTAPTIDGTIDALWADLPVTEVTTEVPDLEESFSHPGCGVFGGFEGNKYTVKMRSVYDASNIYFLVEWNDAVEDLDRQSWYFDATTTRWKQQDKFGCNNGVDNTHYYEDKFAFMWNISMPTTDWDATTCYTNCHEGLSSTVWPDPVKHFTNASAEKTDVWHWKSVRTNLNDQLDDQRWVYADINSPSDPSHGGRGGDTKTSGGYKDNKQSLKLSDDTTITVSVPKYVIPSKTNYFWITKAEVDGGTAKLVTAVNSTGVLTYSGGTIDPTGDSGYTTETGTKRFPSIYHDGPFVGSRADVIAKAVHTGTGWVMEVQRALNTGNDDDVQFDGTSDYRFGIGVFDNAGIAHAINADLKLEFE